MPSFSCFRGPCTKRKTACACPSQAVHTCLSWSQGAVCLQPDCVSFVDGHPLGNIRAFAHVAHPRMRRWYWVFHSKVSQLNHPDPIRQPSRTLRNGPGARSPCRWHHWRVVSAYIYLAPWPILDAGGPAPFLRRILLSEPLAPETEAGGGFPSSEVHTKIAITLPLYEQEQPTSSPPPSPCAPALVEQDTPAAGADDSIS
jgi:hypothetical protein